MYIHITVVKMAELYFTGSLWCNIDIALRRVTSLYERETEALGLTVVEWYILRALYEQDGQMPSQLARIVGRPPTSFTPSLDKIEKAGLIERRQNPTDRRSIKIFLTAKGKALRDEVVEGADRIDNKLRQEFSDKNWQIYERVTALLQTLEK